MADAAKPDAASPARKRRRTTTANFAIAPRKVSAHVSAGSCGAARVGLMMAIPKRLLKRAVDRNTVRRIAREAWLARRPQTSAYGPEVLLRLTARPAALANMSRVRRKKYWRVELDQLFARYFSV